MFCNIECVSKSWENVRTAFGADVELSWRISGQSRFPLKIPHLVSFPDLHVETSSVFNLGYKLSTGTAFKN